MYSLVEDCGSTSIRGSIAAQRKVLWINALQSCREDIFGIHGKLTQYGVLVTASIPLSIGVGNKIPYACSSTDIKAFMSLPTVLMIVLQIGLSYYHVFS